MKTFPFLIVLMMVIYDLSIHVVFLLSIEDFLIKNKINWWPNFKNLNKKIYQIFWVSYWSIAVVLMIIGIFIILK